MPAKIIWIWACSFLCLLNSCNQEEILIWAPQDVEATVHLLLPPSLSAEKEGAHPYLILSVFDPRKGKEVIRTNTNLFNLLKRNDTPFHPKEQSKLLEIEWGTLKLSMGDYILLSWIDYRRTPEASNYYNTSDLQRVTLKEVKGNGVKDAYAACTAVHINKVKDQLVNLTFHSPISIYRFLINTSSDKFLGKRLLLEHQGYYPIAYNVLESRCTSAIHKPQWNQNIFQQGKGMIHLMEGIHFIDNNHPTTQQFNLYIGNTAGHLLYEAKQISVSLEPGKLTEKVLEENVFQDYTQNGIIDDEFSGDINIEI